MKIIIFGASGDLAKRKLFPALYKIYDNSTEIIGYARTEFKEGFNNEIRKYYEYRTDFPERIRYVKGEYTNLAPLMSIIDNNTVIYLSLPPNIHPEILDQLKNMNISSINIEKPYGVDKESLKKYLVMPTNKLNFIDHYLLKPMTIILPDLLNNDLALSKSLEQNYIKLIRCNFIETILSEGREYFNKNGTVKDVMQNHLIEVLASILHTGEHKSMENKRLEFIKTLYLNINVKPVFGQYETYKEEFKKSTNTETFASFEFIGTDPRVMNVPFIFSGGKGLNRKSTEIIFEFKEKHFDELRRLFMIPENHKFDGLSLIYCFGPLSEIFISLKTNGKEDKIILYNNKKINEKFYQLFKEKKDYEIIFDCLLKGKDFPKVSYDEAHELWKLFEKINGSERNLVIYKVGDSLEEVLKKAK